MKYAIPLLLALGACSTANTDQFGTAYPPECSQAATDKVTVPILYTTTAESPHLLPKFKGYDTFGYTHRNRNGEPIMLAVDERFAGWRREDLKRHERCHVLVGDWHE